MPLSRQRAERTARGRHPFEPSIKGRVAIVARGSAAADRPGEQTKPCIALFVACRCFSVDLPLAAAVVLQVRRGHLAPSLGCRERHAPAVCRAKSLLEADPSPSPSCNEPRIVTATKKLAMASPRSEAEVRMRPAASVRYAPRGTALPSNVADRSSRVAIADEHRQPRFELACGVA